MKYICALLSVRDIHAAKAFYQELFGLEVAQDYGRNIAFTCGLALQQDFDWLIGVPSMHVRKKPNNMELVFEETDFDGFIEKLDAYPGIERLGGIMNTTGASGWHAFTIQMGTSLKWGRTWGW